MSSSETLLDVVDERERTTKKDVGVGDWKLGVVGTIWFVSTVVLDPKSVSVGEITGVS